MTARQLDMFAVMWTIAILLMSIPGAIATEGSVSQTFVLISICDVVIMFYLLTRTQRGRKYP